MICFIRHQENELLVPIYSEVQELNATTRQHARLLEKYQQQNIADGQRLDAFLPRLRSIENVLMAMQDRLLEKEMLKRKFRKILDFYINHRERSEEHTSELQSLMRISYAVFCLKKKTQT